MITYNIIHYILYIILIKAANSALHDIQACHVSLQRSTDQVITLSPTVICKGEDVATPAFVDGHCLFEHSGQLRV